MKKLYFLLITIFLGLFIVGCGEQQNITNTNDISTPIITETLGTFMRDNDIEKTALDIEFDYSNNLETYFAITGIATLDDYYNWAYDSSLEKDFFCLRITPTEDSAKETWYLYCSRSEGKEIFEVLKEKDLRIFAKCIVPINLYEEGQNNMASIKLIEIVDW